MSEGLGFLECGFFCFQGFDQCLEFAVSVEKVRQLRILFFSLKKMNYYKI